VGGGEGRGGGDEDRGGDGRLTIGKTI
jgi:hypothetical protein